MTDAALAASVMARPGSVEHWALHKPGALAIVEGVGDSLTWAQWNESADEFAAGLIERGIQSGDLIGLRMHPRIEWAIVTAALAKLGCRVLGINSRLTPSEMAYLLSSSQAAALVTDDEDPSPLLPVLEHHGIQLRISLASAPDFEAYGDLFVKGAPALYSQDEAPLTIYTSGTTGFPKGVVVGGSRETEFAKAYIADIERAHQRSVGDVMLSALPFSHGSGPGHFRTSIRYGSLIVLMRRFEPEEALKLIERHKINNWTAVPTMIKRIMSLPKEVVRKYDLSSMRVVSIGGSPVFNDMKLWVNEHFGEGRLRESYGASECGIIAGMPPEFQLTKPGSCGKPYTNVFVEIRDEDQKVLPVRTNGEIWVKTPVIIKSYLNAPPLDFDTLDERGFYRTGDGGWIDEDGFIYINDRIKDMIVSGGVNIYPAEIEAVLVTHPAVQDAAVIGIPHDEFGEQIKAFIELKPGCAASVDEIAQTAGDHLASYKLPRSIEIVDELPRNPTGKVLKKDLRAKYWEGQERNV